MKKNVEAIIVTTLLDLGISPNTKGYHYLRDGILICVTSEGNLTVFSKDLYSKLAEAYHTTECSVERAVRHAIKSGWYRYNEELAEVIFMNTLQSENDIPTNSVFISTISEWIRINYSDLL
ncbi:sporulation initiation factor Spo0A C-terminal domain-containing protein [Ruminococcus sp.]|uniref:sporulation initiation factor Spo0A C-terminal domain-containing protein n=1 Tax=Ruminococcus sp. TaxID=41978 RepID=UPI002C10A8AE|nr:sporulation initiation factor Spo0A C-terminal domain-containing protein [Ruminococcus sp.]HOA00532.1 sporulation initiation factor Spo0A C-terminal domain-containing protein [Ruminococcus sp.]HOH88073.1 sporulation initiation factor Spo0A C-terminal domain-containing protein [Ruminococcus sp.]